MALLEVKDVHTFYGNIEALKGISIEVQEGECVTLIGSNGAGKSTTLRSISGLTPPRQGSIRFQDREITETPPQEIVSMGVAHSPEGRHVFSYLVRATTPGRFTAAPARAEEMYEPEVFGRTGAATVDVR